MVRIGAGVNYLTITELYITYYTVCLLVHRTAVSRSQISLSDSQGSDAEEDLSAEHLLLLIFFLPDRK